MPGIIPAWQTSSEKEGVGPNPGLGVLPATRHSAGDPEQKDGHRRENRDLQPEVRDRLVAPENFRESVDSPRVNGQQAGLLHGFRHQETWEHCRQPRTSREMTRVERAPNCARLRQMLASKNAKGRQATALETPITMNPGISTHGQGVTAWDVTCATKRSTRNTAHRQRNISTSC